MGVQKYQISIADSKVKVRVESWNSSEPKFAIDDGGGKVHFDIENISLFSIHRTHRFYHL